MTTINIIMAIFTYAACAAMIGDTIVEHIKDCKKGDSNVNRN